MARCASRTWTVKGQRGFFGRCRKIDREVIKQIARVGILVGIRVGGNPERKLAYGNHSNTDKATGEMFNKAIANIANDRAIVFSIDRVRNIQRL